MRCISMCVSALVEVAGGDFVPVVVAVVLAAAVAVAAVVCAEWDTP